MKIYLLTHPRELKRKTNTGQIVLNCLGDMADRIIWDRVSPDLKLVELIENSQVALMYPKEGVEYSPLELFENILIIDSTWQEANKIFNRSSYLKDASKVTLGKNLRSSFKLRRNQPMGGLCTAESVIEWLRIKNKTELANRLEQEFILFND